MQAALRQAGAAWGVRMGSGHVYYRGHDERQRLVGKLTEYEDGPTGLYDDIPVLLPEGEAFLAEHGIEVPRTVTVEKYRSRKQWALCVIHPDSRGRHQTVAYFRSEELADQFVEFLKVLVRDK